MEMHKVDATIKHRRRGYDLYLAYLPLEAVREAATSEVWRCSGFPVKASLNSCSDSAEKVSALPWP